MRGGLLWCGKIVGVTGLAKALGGLASSPRARRVRGETDGYGGYFISLGKVCGTEIGSLAIAFPR